MLSHFIRSNLLFVGILALSMPALAQQDIEANVTMPMPEEQTSEAPSVPPGVDILPAKSLSTDELSHIDPDSPTHPMLRITPDKSEIVRLDHEAGSVIIGNPTSISILAENSKTLVIVPKAPGATYFTVLDTKGNIMMQRHVIVASPKEKYVRVRRSCVTAESNTCQNTQIYYCPDMCHEITMNPEAEEDQGMEATLTTGQEGGAANGTGTTSTEVGSDAAGAAQ